MTTQIRRSKTSKDLDRFLKSSKDGRLLAAIDRHLQAREPGFRDWRHLHPSAISKPGWCVRAAYDTITSPTPPSKEKVSRVLQSIFDEGHLIHSKYQTYFHEMGVLYGRWLCKVCRETWWGLSPQFCHNVTCTSPLIEYAEVTLRNDEWLIAGHADGWIKGIGDECLIEIKSVGEGTVRAEAPNFFKAHDGDMKSIWSDLRRPFSSHLNQAQIYLRVLNATTENAPQEVVFIYEAKFNQSSRQFEVAYNESFTDPIIEKALIVKRAVDEQVPPRCLESPITGCPECRS